MEASNWVEIEVISQVLPISILNVHRVRVMVFNAIFNNSSVISWRSTLLVKETGVPRENHRPAASQ